MRFSNGGWELYAETFGSPADPAIVLLHGGGSSMMAWDAELCEALAGRGRFVVRLDARHAGRSVSRDERSTTHDLAGDVVALLDALELPAATLAGVSLGGNTAQIVAVEHPERVSGLVLISTTPIGDDLPGPAEGLFADEPAPPDWSDRDAVVRYLVELERPWCGSRFDEELMTRIAERSVDHAPDIAVQLTPVRRVRPVGPRAAAGDPGADGRRARDRGPDVPARARRGAGRGDPGRPAGRARGRRPRPRPAGRVAGARRGDHLPASTAVERGRASAASVSAQVAARIR